MRAPYFFVGVFLLFTVAAFSQQSLRGLVLEDDRYNQLPIDPDYGKELRLPTQVDNRASFPRVINQSNENNAVAWAATYYGMSALQANSSSVNNALSPAFTYRSVQQKSIGCDVAISLIDVLESLSTQGAVPGKTMGFHCVDTLAKPLYDSAQRYLLSGYTRLFNTYDSKDRKVQAMKRAVHAKSPVVIGLLCPVSFQYVKEFWSPNEKPLPEYGGHAVVVVGYDDTKFGGAFEVVNSWGKSWGKEGYSWIRYADVANFVLYGFEMLSTSEKTDLEITFTTADGAKMEPLISKPGLYRFSQPYLTGQSFFIELFTKTPIFLNVIGIDVSGQSGQLFPATKQSYLLAANLRLPTGGGYYTLEGAPGTNGLLFIFSRTQKALEQVVQSISERGMEALPSQSKSATWEKNKVRLSDKDVLTFVTVEIIQR